MPHCIEGCIIEAFLLHSGQSHLSNCDSNGMWIRDVDLKPYMYMYSRNQKNVTFTVPVLPFFEMETV